MADKKIIAVLGATGAQGGGLVRAILNDKNSEFTPRALVRDVNSEKAKELQRRVLNFFRQMLMILKVLKKLLKVHTEHIVLHFTGHIFLLKKRKFMLRQWLKLPMLPV